MKSTTSALSAPFVLKVVGYVLLFYVLIEYVALLSQMKWSEDQWVAGVLTQMVDRGPIALISLAMIYVSSFLESGSLRAEGRNPFLTGRFFALVLSGILGLSFLVTVPVQFVKTNEVAKVAIDRLAKQSQQQEQQLDAEVKQRLGQMQEEIKDKSKVEAGLKQIGDAIAAGQINGRKIEGAELESLKKSQKDLQKAKDDPSYLQVMAKEASDPQLQKIREGKQKAEDQIRNDTSRVGWKTGLSSLLLFGGFTIISWLGLSEMGIFSKR